MPTDIGWRRLPHAVVFAAAWLVVSWRRRRERAWLAATAAGAALGAGLLALWFGWAVAVYGPRATFLANTSVEAAAPASIEVFATALSTRDEPMMRVAFVPSTMLIKAYSKASGGAVTP